MSLYASYLFPLLRRVDAERAHDATLRVLALAQGTAPGRGLLRRIAGPLANRPVACCGLTFPNRLGVAAGFDKDARVAAGLAQLGFGHVEVGTLTPRPQAGNPRPRVFRLPQDGALINRMGFPNGGVAAALPRLRRLAQADRNCIIGVSLGKQKETPLTEAAADYLAVMEAVYPFADYLAVNISSPNTPGLRLLQGGDYLGHLLRTLVEAGERLAARHAIAPRPLLVKIAPDLTLSELDDVLVAVAEAGIAGIIATNTTLARDGLSAAARNEAGGLSGRPLRERATALVAHIAQATDGRLPIIGVGGVRTAADMAAMLAAGATLVQLYTALVYEGPGLPGRLQRTLDTPAADTVQPSSGGPPSAGE